MARGIGRAQPFTREESSTVRQIFQTGSNKDLDAFWRQALRLRGSPRSRYRPAERLALPSRRRITKTGRPKVTGFARRLRGHRRALGQTRPDQDRARAVGEHQGGFKRLGNAGSSGLTERNSCRPITPTNRVTWPGAASARRAPFDRRSTRIAVVTDHSLENRV